MEVDLSVSRNYARNVSFFADRDTAGAGGGGGLHTPRWEYLWAKYGKRGPVDTPGVK